MFCQVENNIIIEDVSNFSSRFQLSESLHGKHIVITGATGLLGSCMVRCLLDLNNRCSLNLRITCVVRNADKAFEMFGNSVHIIKYDFLSDDTLSLPQDADYAIHFASPTASKYFVDCPVETMTAGILGTQKLLSAALKANCAVVYISSLEVYGAIFDDSKPITEDVMGYVNPMLPRSSYPMAKRAAECLCKSYNSEHGLPVYVARLAQTFGAGVLRTDNRVFAQFARSVVNNEDIVLHTTGELSRCYCYTTDAIEGVLYIMLKGTPGEAYNVANESTYISIADMARFVCDKFNHNIKPVIHLQEGLGYSPVTKLRLDCEKLQALGWTPHYGLTDMFLRLIKSFKQQ